MKWNNEAEAILKERFGRDSVIALASVDEGMPQVRYVNAFYEDGCFYILTHRLSGKMKQLAHNPQAAIAGEWFTAHGTGEDIGSFRENHGIAQKMRDVFSAWIGNGHSDLLDENTCILRIALTDFVLLFHGRRFEWHA